MTLHNLVDDLRRFRLLQRCSGRAVRTSRQPRLFPENLEARVVLTGGITIPLLPAPPTGLATVIANDGSNSMPDSMRDFKKDLATIANPNISGVAFQINWADIEPDGPATSFKPKWGRIDQVFQAVQNTDKWVQLLISPGFWSPKWIFNPNLGVENHQFHPQYGRDSKGSALLPLPMPFSTNMEYFTQWNDFLQLVDQRYGGNLHFRMIAAAGPTSGSDEFTEPDPPPGQSWANYGYTLQNYEGAWQTVFGDYAKDFPIQYVSLSHGNGISSPEQTREDLLQDGSAALGAQFAYQSSALTGLLSHHDKAITEVITQTDADTTGYQLGSAFETAPDKMGAPGDPPLALVRSIDNGMLLNADNKHVDYIEVHAADVESADLQPVLKWAASLFPKESALNVIMTPQVVVGGLRLKASQPVRSVTVNVTFSDPVTDFTVDKLVVSKGGVISDFTPPAPGANPDSAAGSTYSFTLSGPANGSPTTVDIPANKVHDQNGSGNTRRRSSQSRSIRSPGKQLRLLLYQRNPGLRQEEKKEPRSFEGSELRAGWPQGIAPPGLPRIRTCPIGHTARHVMNTNRTCNAGTVRATRRQPPHDPQQARAFSSDGGDDAA